MSTERGPHTTIDGIPAFIGGSDDQLVAGLVIRVGECDEQLANHGISHLIEHLLLSGMRRGLGSWNGFVDHQTTNFMVQGRPDEIVEFFATISEGVLNPPYARIPTEAQVLRTEAAGRGGRGMLAAAAGHRIGPRNYGIRDFREFCFDHPDPQLVHRWLATHYTTGNAAFWCTGPLPAGLRIPLPAGPRVPPPPPTWNAESYPAYVRQGRDSVAMTTVGEWSHRSQFALSVAREHLFEVLRTTHGLSYDVSAGSEALMGGRLLHSAVWADGLVENLGAIRDHMVIELNRLAWDGPSPDLMARVEESLRHELERELADDDFVTAPVEARCHVLDAPFTTTSELIAEFTSLTPHDLARSVQAALDNALWIIPESLTWNDRRLEHIRRWSASTVTGHPTPVAVPDGPQDRRRLIVATEGLTMLFGEESHPVTTRFDGIAALLAYPDGNRTVVGDDGFVIRIEANRWPDAGALVGYIDGRTPPDRIVRMPAQS